MGDIRDSFEQEANNTKVAAATLSAALVARAFEVMLPKHEASLSLEHNQHKAYHQTIAEHFADFDHEPEWVTPVERQKAIVTGELWTLYWCPESAVGSRHVAAATLPALAQWLEDNGLAFEG